MLACRLLYAKGRGWCWGFLFEKRKCFFPCSPSPQVLLPCPALGVHSPSVRVWSDPAPPLGAGRTPPRGVGFAGRSLSWRDPASKRWKVSPKAGALPDTGERSLPLGDVCVPFLTPPDNTFPLRGSRYSPDSAPSLLRMGARGTPSPGPPLHMPQLPPLLGLLLAVL